MTTTNKAKLFIERLLDASYYDLEKAVCKR